MSDAHKEATKLVVVSGASGHLGQAIVQSFLGQPGINVIALGRSRTTHSEEILARWRNQSPEITYLFSDELPVGDRALTSRIQEAFPRGKIVALINNAASQALGALEELTAEQWMAMLNDTFHSVVTLTQEVLTVMDPGAAVVNISSVEACVAFPNHGAYASAKAALEAYTRSIAGEYAPLGIRANTVAPGLIERDGLAQGWPQGYQAWQRTAPNGTPVTAEQVARVVAFLASSESSGVSGTVIPVDGGWLSSARLSL